MGKSAKPSKSVSFLREVENGSTSSAETVAGSLRHSIQNDELHPGEWLREAWVCREFGVGRSVVRRALRILRDDGLVKIEENRGAQVAQTTAEEVFDLYEVRAALYGLAARFACMRATDDVIDAIVFDIDQLLAAASAGTPAEQIVELSESIFGKMASYASSDAQAMIASVRRKTRYHFSYAALAIKANALGPYIFWREVRRALIARDAVAASQGARDIFYFLQAEVARLMLTHGSRHRGAGRETRGS